MKKNIAGILVGASLLTLACLCCPTNIITFGNTPVTAPSKPTIAPTAVTTPSAVVPVCDQKLEQVLEGSESVTALSRRPRLDREYTLVTYAVNGDTITDPVYDSVPNSLKDYQQDTVSQEKIWDFITMVIPADQRVMVTGFSLFTDGNGEFWVQWNRRIIHKIGCLRLILLTGTTSLTWQRPSFMNSPICSPSMIPRLRLTIWFLQIPITGRSMIGRPPPVPTISRLKGVANQILYLNTFFNRFWPGIYNEWQAIDAETDHGQPNQKFSHFYHKYYSQFVSEYAATSPSEDIAETFMVYIFLPKPSDTTIADQKILFFYKYPELVALREQILSNLCPFVEKR